MELWIAQEKMIDYLMFAYKVGYFINKPCIFSPNGCENAFY